jgi:hypothetical protein
VLFAFPARRLNIARLCQAGRGWVLLNHQRLVGATFAVVSAGAQRVEWRTSQGPLISPPAAARHAFNLGLDHHLSARSGPCASAAGGEQTVCLPVWLAMDLIRLCTGCFHDRRRVKDVPIREHINALRISVIKSRQGGRLVAERTMISELHVFDLKTYYWQEPNRPHPDDPPPPARYFHSADQCERFACYIHRKVAHPSRGRFYRCIWWHGKQPRLSRP